MIKFLFHLSSIAMKNEQNRSMIMNRFYWSTIFTHDRKIRLWARFTGCSIQKATGKFHKALFSEIAFNNPHTDYLISCFIPDWPGWPANRIKVCTRRFWRSDHRRKDLEPDCSAASSSLRETGHRIWYCALHWPGREYPWLGMGFLFWGKDKKYYFG